MQVKQLFGISVVVLATALVAGCGGESGGPSSPLAMAGEKSTEPTEHEAQSDAEICIAFGDVLTVIWNAEVGLEEARMAAQEELGWNTLATRILDRLPSDGTSDVHSAIASLKQAAPAMSLGAYAETTGIGTQGWDLALDDLGAACEAVAEPLAGAMFTGG